MFIEIRKAGFVNKGAELMLLAIMDQLAHRYPAARLVMAPTLEKGSAPFGKRARLGLYQKASLWRYGYQLGDLMKVLPSRIRELYGIVLDEQIDLVLDAAGFAYSDQWGPSNAQELAQSSDRWARQGTKFILMPQAFGPFSSKKIQQSMIRIVSNANLVFARDRTSFNHLVEVVGDTDKIRIAPDFTNLLPGAEPQDPNYFHDMICIVPNYRMIDKVSEQASSSYIPFMRKVIATLRKEGAKMFVLVHEGRDDAKLAEAIIAGYEDIPVIQENDPLYIKGILGACKGTIGSRFHGLVSSLSQGVPSLATGWSHKYLELFEDYGCGDCVLSFDIGPDRLEELLQPLLDEKRRAQASAQLLVRSEVLKHQTSEMWRSVFNVVTQ